MTTLDKLKDLITQDIYHCREDIVPEAELLTDLMMDPEDVDDLALMCEREFEIHILGTEHLDKVVTVGDMVELIDHLKV